MTKKVNYISLCKEVGVAKRKGLTSHEIVGAVRKAIPVGELKTYLGSVPNVTLEEQLLTLNHSDYKEKYGLFWTLANICQRDTEDGTQILFRALNLH